MQTPTQSISFIEMDQERKNATTELELSLAQLQKIIDATKKNNSADEQIDLAVKLREALAAVVEKSAPLCQLLESPQPSAEATDGPKKEEKKILVDGQKSLSLKVKGSPSVVVPIKKQLQEQVTEKMALTPSQIGYVAGKLFANAKRLEKTYGVKVIFPPKGAGNEIILKGPADRVIAAIKEILDTIPWSVTHQIEERFIGLIIGRQGETIQYLRKKFNVDINTDKTKKEVLIGGKKVPCEDALRAIKLIIAKREKFEANIAAADKK